MQPVDLSYKVSTESVKNLEKFKQIYVGFLSELN